MLRNVNSKTNVKIDINYVIDHQNMLEHNHNKELGIFVFESDIFFSIRDYPNLRHRCPFMISCVQNIVRTSFEHLSEYICFVSFTLRSLSYPCKSQEGARKLIFIVYDQTV